MLGDADGTAPAPEFSEREARTDRITATNEVELEKARASSRRATAPPRHNTPSALSIANARVPSAPNFPAAKRLTPTGIEAAVLGVIGSGPGPEITEHTIEDPIAEMRERLSLGDYTGAFEMAELLLAEDPDDAEAAECAASCREVLRGDVRGATWTARPHPDRDRATDAAALAVDRPSCRFRPVADRRLRRPSR